jgi:hypothetical protein
MGVSHKITSNLHLHAYPTASTLYLNPQPQSFPQPQLNQ